MKKFAFIGGGSFGFTRTLVRDLLTFPAFRDAEIALMDIDSERLDYIKQACEQIVEKGGYPAKVTATTDRVEALKGADGVLCTILSGDVDVWRYDIEIPKKYGVDINVGDTRGPAGIFRMLRTMPVMLDICKDIEEHCPNAVFLNYTNPMAMLCSGMQKKFPNLKITGLCHSVQGTVGMLSVFMGVDVEDITYTCAGINHQAFYTEFKYKGEDAYPMLREALKDPKWYNHEIVRNNMFLNLGYYITESSGHNSEYVAWYRKRDDLIEKYCHQDDGWNPGTYAFILNEYLARKDTWRDAIKNDLNDSNFNLTRGNEYAAFIFNAMFGDCKPFVFNGNVPNNGSIPNLPESCCVEIPVLARKGALEPLQVGPLPDHLALMLNTPARSEELAVDGYFTGDKDKVFHSIAFDPLTSAVLSLDEIREMVDEMFEANRDFLAGQFKY
ncbi:MAG: alpha-glucosidase/alpha-galactosidase [Oscillospiraceae bacterium]|nr:alpha-glucosidase/alpha-galactosidase [Oscillospiraceae bacterium]